MQKPSKKGWLVYCKQRVERSLRVNLKPKPRNQAKQPYSYGVSGNINIFFIFCVFYFESTVLLGLLGFREKKVFNPP